MDLQTFFRDINIKESGVITDNLTSILTEIFDLFTDHKAVSFTYSTSFVINNISVMQFINIGGVGTMHTFTVPISGSVGDIVSDITSNVPCDILLNDIAVDCHTPVVLCNGQYTDKKIRFYIDPNNVPDRVNLNYKVLVLKNDLRRQLMCVQELYAGESVCRFGVISKR